MVLFWKKETCENLQTMRIKPKRRITEGMHKTFTLYDEEIP